MEREKRGRQCCGIITDLFLCEEKGGAPRQEEVLSLIAGRGIRGDLHADGGPRQISMLQKEAADWMEEQEISGLCFKRYKANLRVDGLSPSLLLPGTRLQAGSAVIAVSEPAKACFPACVLLQSGKSCRLSEGGVFLIVEETGIIKKGDKIVIIA